MVMNLRLQKLLTINDLIAVADEVTTLKEASMRVGMSLGQFKKFARNFKDPATDINFYELIRSKKNKGNQKTKYNRIVRKVKKPKNLDLKLVTEGYKRNLLKEHELKFYLISGGYKKQVCETCGYDQKRGIDYKAPLKLLFKDGKTYNGKLDNLEFICYNCHFLHHPNHKVMEDIIYDTDINNISIVSDKPVIDSSIDIDDFEKIVKRYKSEKKMLTNNDVKIDFDDPYAFVTNKKLIEQ